jgi:ribonuclease Z
MHQSRAKLAAWNPCGNSRFFSERRVAVRLIAVLMGSLLLTAGMSDAAQSDFRVTLIGSGNPVPAVDRFGPATLVEAGDQKLLFDAGRGATIRLWQLKIPFSKVTPLFLTHLHSDHTVGIPDLWLTGWLGGPFGRRTTPFHVIGPSGTKDLMSNLEQAYAADIHIRIADEKYPPEGIKVVSEEFGTDGIVYEKNGVRVTAFEVNHGDEIKPAYGYRVDYKGRSVVISGDTRFNENVIKYSTGADVLVHEVAAVRPELLSDQQVQRVMAHHTSPREAGTVFSRAQPKLAVYTHLTLLERPKIPAVTVEELVAQTRETYSGPLEVGDDLMSIEIDDTGHPIVQRKGTRPSDNQH